MADNVSIPRDRFDLIVDSVADLGETFEENMKQAEKLFKSVKKTINENKLARGALIKIFDKLKKSSSTSPADQIEGQEVPHDASDIFQEFDKESVPAEQPSIENEAPKEPENITITMSEGFGDYDDKSNLELYKRIFEAMQKLIKSKNINDNARVRVSEFCL